MNTFGTVINCMDGRVQFPVIDYIKKEHHINFVDSITEPGPIKALAEFTDKSLIRSIQERIRISVEAHHSRLIAVAAHHDCAGNPESEPVQKNQIQDAVSNLQKLYQEVSVIGLWVDESGQVARIV